MKKCPDKVLGGLNIPGAVNSSLYCEHGMQLHFFVLFA